MIDRHLFVMLLGLIGTFNPRLAFLILFGYMVFLKIVEEGWIII